MNLPVKIIDFYKKIKNSDLILNKVLSEENIIDFQNNLNNAQPENDDELKMQVLIQYLYRANPINFIRFLTRSRLSHLILWTESKCIVKHFGIYGIVYIKWNENQYECQMHKYAHKNIDIIDIENQLKENTYNEIYKKNMRYHRDDRKQSSDYETRSYSDRQQSNEFGFRNNDRNSYGRRRYSDSAHTHNTVRDDHDRLNSSSDNLLSNDQKSTPVVSGDIKEAE